MLTGILRDAFCEASRFSTCRIARTRKYTTIGVVEMDVRDRLGVEQSERGTRAAGERFEVLAGIELVEANKVPQQVRKSSFSARIS